MFFRPVRTTQPQGPARLDPSSRFYSRLIAVLDPIGRRDLVTGRPLTIVGSFPKTAGKYGVSAKGDAASLGYVTVSGLGEEMSMLGVMSNATCGTTGSLEFGLGSSAGTALACYQSTSNPANRFLLRQTNGGGVSSTAFANNAYTAGPYVVGASFSGSSSTGIFPYLNGRQDRGSVLDGSSGSNAIFDRFSIGGISRGTNTGAAVGDDCALAVLLRGVLAEEEFKSLSENPWQIFAPDTKSLWVPDTIVSLPSLISGFWRKPVVRTSQPQGPARIDWSNPITRGLVSAFDTSKGYAHDLVAGKLFNNGGWASSSIGSVRGSGKLNANAPIAMPGYFQRSVFTRFLVMTAGTSGSLVSESGTGTNNARVQIDTTTIALDRASVANYVNAPVPTQGVFNATVVSGANNQYIYVNGKLGASRAGTTFYAHNGNGYLLTNTATAAPYLALHLEWDRELSPAEIKSLSDNPWQVFAPDSKALWSPAASAVVSFPNFVAAGARMGRSVRTTQPQSPARIDWGNPITRGLVCAINAANPSASDFGPATIQNRAFGIGPSGVCMARNSSSTKVFNAAVRPIPRTNDFTIFGLVVNRSTNTEQGIASTRPNDGLNSGCDFRFEAGLLVLNVFSGSKATSPQNLLVVGKPHVAFVARRSGVAHFYVDGVSAGSAAQTSDMQFSDGFGIQNNANSQSEVYLNGFWNRALSDAEIKSISANPWQIFAPDSKSLWTPAAASVTLPTLVQPSSTTSAGAWTATGAATLHGAINELVPSDAQYISVNSASTTELLLAEAAYPGASNQTLAYWASSTQGSTLTVTLKQGVTTIMTRTHSLTGTDTLYTQTLTAPEIALITAGPISVTLTTS